MAESPEVNLPVIFLHNSSPETWSKVEEVLKPIATDGVADVASLNRLLCNVKRIVVPAVADSISFGALRKAVEGVADRRVCGSMDHFLTHTIRFMAQLVLDLPKVISDDAPIHMLLRGRPGQNFLTRKQCAAVLAGAFFGALPADDEQSRGSQLRLPGLNLTWILSGYMEKALCLLCYFQLVSAASIVALEEVVSFARQTVANSDTYNTAEFWSSLLLPLKAVTLKRTGSIEDADGCLQADFANEYLGGGVLQAGMVQEEIRFSVCPECIVGMLFSEVMLENEAIFIVGAQQFSHYSGYDRSFRFEGPTSDTLESIKSVLPPDHLNRRGPHLVAFDALFFDRAVRSTQYEDECIHRELQKAYVACLGDPSEGETRQLAFATGNWGCGAFGGDPQLKFLIQWLAASAANREIWYYPFGDARLKDLARIVEIVQGRAIGCKELYGHLKNHDAGNVFSNLLDLLQTQPQ